MASTGSPVTMADLGAATAPGRLLWVEGRYVGRARRVGVLRPGPWGQTVTEWGVQLNTLIAIEEPNATQDLSGRDGAGKSDAGAAGKALALIYWVGVGGGSLVEPPRSGGEPFGGVVRFYKWWEDRDASGAAVRVPIFVGARPTEPVLGLFTGKSDRHTAGDPGRPNGGGSLGGGIVAAVITLAAALVAVRWYVWRSRAKPTATPPRRRGGGHDEETEPAEDLPLSADPAEALGQLAAKESEDGPV